MRFTWGAFYAFLFAYRCVFAVLGQTVVMQMTSVPDTTTYQQFGLAASRQFGIGYFTAAAAGSELSVAMQQYATLLTIALGGLFGFVARGNAILINICFQTVAFIGILRLLMAIDVRSRRFLALLVMFPSFSVWSSIASKEAVVVGLVGLACGFIIDIYRGKYRFRVWHLAPLFLLYVYKPQFVPALFFLMAVPLVARRIRQPTAVALLAGVASVALLYVFRDAVDNYVMQRMRGFHVDTGSTRDFRLLTEQYDYFAKAPLGFMLAFIGPTLSEASGGILHLASFVESVALLVVMFIFVLPRLPGMPAYLAIVVAFSLFWILLPNYPLGISNPGTAVRYRTDWILFVYLAAFVLTSRPLFVTWREARRRGRSPPTLAASP